VARRQRTDPPLCLSRCPPRADAPPRAPRQARDINLDIKRVVAYRHWCNKLWNAVRFAMLNLGEGFAPPAAAAPGAAPARAGAPLPCRWVLARLSAAAAAVVGGLTSFEFAAATHVRAPWAPQGKAGAVAGPCRPCARDETLR